eukprot:NODE_648_length_5041_cov_0.519021.p3 type:complete len:280 gc:universal NODE_648_length_5041_cov_0.519021:2130-1291(-)
MLIVFVILFGFRELGTNSRGYLDCELDNGHQVTCQKRYYKGIVFRDYYNFATGTYGYKKPTNIVSICHMIESGNGMFWYTEVCDFYNSGSMDFATFKRLSIDVLKGIEYLHILGMHHMNIQPRNIVKCGDVFKLKNLENLGSLGKISIVNPGWLVASLYAPTLRNQMGVYYLHSGIWDLVSYAKSLYEMSFGDIYLKLCYDLSDDEMKVKFQKKNMVLEMTDEEYSYLMKLFELTMNCDLKKIEKVENLFNLQWFQESFASSDNKQSRSIPPVDQQSVG